MDPGSLLSPATGMGGALVLLIGYILRQMILDRRDYREAISIEKQARKDAEARVGGERRRADALQLRIDAELEKRRTAEGTAALAVAERIQLQRLVDWYKDERRRMEQYLPPPQGPFLPDPPQKDEP